MELGYAGLGLRNPAAAFELEGRVTTPTVRIPISRAMAATTGAAPVPVPPPMPADKFLLSSVRRRARSSLFSSAARLPTAGLAPQPLPAQVLRLSGLDIA